jgi:hypothetical protein
MSASGRRQNRALGLVRLVASYGDRGLSWPKQVGHDRARRLVAGRAAFCCGQAVGLLHGQCTCPDALEDAEVGGGHVTSGGRPQVEDGFALGRDAIDVLGD